MFNPAESTIVAVHIGSDVPVPGIGSKLPQRLVATKDPQNGPCIFQYCEFDGCRGLDVAYKTKKFFLPMSFVTLIEYK